MVFFVFKTITEVIRVQSYPVNIATDVRDKIKERRLYGNAVKKLSKKNNRFIFDYSIHLCTS